MHAHCHSSACNNTRRLIRSAPAHGTKPREKSYLTDNFRTWQHRHDDRSLRSQLGGRAHCKRSLGDQIVHRLRAHLRAMKRAVCAIAVHASTTRSARQFEGIIGTDQDLAGTNPCLPGDAGNFVVCRTATCACKGFPRGGTIVGSSTKPTMRGTLQST